MEQCSWKIKVRRYSVVNNNKIIKIKVGKEAFIAIEQYVLLEIRGVMGRVDTFNINIKT